MQILNLSIYCSNQNNDHNYIPYIHMDSKTQNDFLKRQFNYNWYIVIYNKAEKDIHPSINSVIIFAKEYMLTLDRFCMLHHKVNFISYILSLKNFEHYQIKEGYNVPSLYKVITREYLKNIKTQQQKIDFTTKAGLELVNINANDKKILGIDLNKKDDYIYTMDFYSNFKFTNILSHIYLSYIATLNLKEKNNNNILISLINLINFNLGFFNQIDSFKVQSQYGLEQKVNDSNVKELQKSSIYGLYLYEEFYKSFKEIAINMSDSSKNIKEGTFKVDQNFVKIHLQDLQALTNNLIENEEEIIKKWEVEQKLLSKINNKVNEIQNPAKSVNNNKKGFLIAGGSAVGGLAFYYLDDDDKNDKNNKNKKKFQKAVDIENKDPNNVVKN